ncbi:LysR family transcriptional regulator [Lactobacillus corticis]|uniref:LysR family transcriptional regulator n=1 Tax=Lactobacillus corticis TaxID=2201249 RepID=A0A916QL38_9LACO|nr:LysR family transcriptional regulator [Lactobacillus corticis]GFZ27516.1 LysR family transcriptional regulator [Lactobacillus corticis]
MDSNQLRIFIQVAQEGSFDRVADQNYVSQRAVSRLVKRLENEIGLKLFERGANRIKLTPSGEYFAKRAEEYLDVMDDAIYVAQDIENKQKENLKIGYFSIFDGVLMRDEILHYQASKLKPEISFTTVEESVEHILADLSLHRLDCGYINQYGKYRFINRNLYNFVNVYQNEMVLGISKQNPLAEKEIITESDLVGQRLLYYSVETSDFMRDTFLETLGKQWSSFHIKRVSSIEQLMFNCSLNHGLAYITKGLAEKFLAPDDNIVFKSLASEKIDQTYTMQLIYRKDDDSLALKKFIASLKNID